MWWLVPVVVMSELSSSRVCTVHQELDHAYEYVLWYQVLCSIACTSLSHDRRQATQPTSKRQSFCTRPWQIWYLLVLLFNVYSDRLFTVDRWPWRRWRTAAESISLACYCNYHQPMLLPLLVYRSDRLIDMLYTPQKAAKSSFPSVW